MTLGRRFEIHPTHLGYHPTPRRAPTKAHVEVAGDMVEEQGHWPLGASAVPTGGSPEEWYEAADPWWSFGNAGDQPVVDPEEPAFGYGIGFGWADGNGGWADGNGGEYGYIDHDIIANMLDDNPEGDGYG